jgi:hypothetical protein
MHKNKIYVPSSGELRNSVLKEMHNVPHAIYLDYQKTIATIRSQFFWPGMKKDGVDYIVICMECQKVKVEHRHPTGFLQPLPIPNKKWEVVTIGFITTFLRKKRKHDLIMVLVDKLTKVTHFVLVNMTHTTSNIGKIYIREIYMLHGIPTKIVSYRDTTFTANLWRVLFKGFGTNINFITTYHP